MQNPMDELEIRDHARAGDHAKLRQIQYAGRRYAISIEPVYWDCLEEAATELNIRLNQLVSYLAGLEIGPKNLAARLRLFCVRRLQRLVRQAELHTGSVDVVNLVEAVPTPCFAIYGNGEIAHANNPLSQLVNEDASDVIGQPAAKFFRLRFADTRADQPAAKPHSQKLLSGTVALMIPGRVSARRFAASEISLPDRNQTLLLIFIK
jgi:predicted DNA-binding ribbon-helix-helix protein